MYEKDNRDQLMLSAFSMPFGGKLKSNNRWIKLSEKIDWNTLEDEYAASFSQKGKRAVKCRVAYAALLIKEILGVSDKETVELICENPYLQYFCGFSVFQVRRPFSYRSMTRFRKRFAPELLSKKYVKSLLGKKKSK